MQVFWQVFLKKVYFSVDKKDKSNRQMVIFKVALLLSAAIIALTLQE